jgi:CheY-like chemotaxis protein
MDFELDTDTVDDRPKVLLIDDEPFIHDLVGEALDECCSVISVETGEDALMASKVWQPDLIIVDVEMPGVGGYETCRRFKSIDETAGTPVVFLSGHDLIDDRLKGYEAGGDDYLTKPFAPQELKAKVQHLLARASQRGELKSMADFATSTAMTAMTSMGEMGVLLEALKNFNACADYPALADALVASLSMYDLQGVVQLRAPEGKISRTAAGEATPLEASVIDHLAAMERIMQFQTRLSITCENVSLLVKNMPVDDEDRCGRLRDHLAMLAEGADVRLRGLTTTRESSRRGEVIEHVLARISDALRAIDRDQRQQRIKTSLALDDALRAFDRALLSVALSDEQDAYLSATIKQGINRIVDSQSNEIDIQDRLTSMIAELQSAMAK